MGGVAVGYTFEAHLGALNEEVAAVMRPLVAPMVEKLSWVRVDDEQVHETVRSWQVMSEALSQVAANELAGLDRLDGGWVGLARRAFEEAVDQVVGDLDGLAARTGEVADLLDEAAIAVQVAEQDVRQLICGFIEWAASAAPDAGAATTKAGLIGARIASRIRHLGVELHRIRGGLEARSCGMGGSGAWESTGASNELLPPSPVGAGALGWGR